MINRVFLFWQVYNDNVTLLKKPLKEADDAVFQIDETFPSTDNIRKLVIQEAKVPKIHNFPETMQKHVSLLDAENLIYVLSDSGMKGNISDFSKFVISNLFPG